MEKTLEKLSLPGFNNYLYLGADNHKDQHTISGMNCFCQVLYQKEIGNSEQDFKELVGEVKELAGNLGLMPVFGLENTSSYGLRLAQYLFQQGFDIKTVSPVLVERERKYQTHPEKSDSQDASGVARALIQRIGKLPTFSISKTEELANEIKEVVVDRESLVKEQTRVKNQLHRLLHTVHNSEYGARFKNPFSKKALDCWLRSCPKIDSPILKKRLRRKVERLRHIKREISETEEELRFLLDKTDQKMGTLNGCGLVLTACLLAEIKNIERFKSAGSLAKYGGFCPREKSSGKKIKHIKTKSGNRRLNKTVHRIALSQIGRNGNIYSKAYFKKKISEGKSKAQALCCLKRRLVDVIFMMLKYQQEYKIPAKS